MDETRFTIEGSRASQDEVVAKFNLKVEDRWNSREIDVLVDNEDVDDFVEWCEQNQITTTMR